MKHLALVSMPRSGSTLIAEMVALHPATLGFTEIFHDDPELRKKCHHRGAGDNGLFAYDHSAYGRPDLYLDWLEATAALKGKSVLSYKLMESQCPSVFAELPRRRSFIVHTRRDNLVALAASWKVALATNRWHSTKPEHREECASVRVKLTVEEVEEWERREAAQLALLKATRLPVLTIPYREINNCPENVVKRLFDLIEVAPCSPPQTQIKTNTRKLSEMVENIEELQDHLAGTRYAWMGQDGKESL